MRRIPPPIDMGEHQNRKIVNRDTEFPHGRSHRAPNEWAFSPLKRSKNTHRPPFGDRRGKKEFFLLNTAGLFSETGAGRRSFVPEAPAFRRRTPVEPRGYR